MLGPVMIDSCTRPLTGSRVLRLVWDSLQGDFLKTMARELVTRQGTWLVLFDADGHLIILGLERMTKQRERKVRGSLSPPSS